MGIEHDYFAELFDGLPRWGPGSDDATERALRLVQGLPLRPNVADLGCGPGRSTLILAAHTNGIVTAVDRSPSAINAVAKAAAECGLQERIRPVVADMARPPIEAGSLDLLWSEGAIYILGFAKGLDLWRPLLKAGAWIAVTEATWLTSNPPAQVRSFWGTAYPAMSSIDDNVATLQHHGYEPQHTFVLPASAWWDDYYGPLSARFEAYRQRHKGSTEAEQFLLEIEAEVALYRDHQDAYGYVFYLATAI